MGYGQFDAGVNGLKRKKKVVVNNYSPKWRWIVVDIYRAAKW